MLRNRRRGRKLAGSALHSIHSKNSEDLDPGLPLFRFLPSCDISKPAERLQSAPLGRLTLAAPFRPRSLTPTLLPIPRHPPTRDPVPIRSQLEPPIQRLHFQHPATRTATTPDFHSRFTRRYSTDNTVAQGKSHCH